MTIKELHVFTPILLLMIMGGGVLSLAQFQVPPLAALLTLEGLASVWVYYDSRALRLKYPNEWKQAELGSPFWIWVTALIFAPIGLPLYTYELNSLNKTLKEKQFL